jgi:glyoxylase-like metal-dependent hydrolase (beta-lactamase superfamily II)/rhodanese-related sulfurtransferase
VSASGAGAPAIGIGELLARLDRGDDLLLLDVRNPDEAAAWRVEGRRPVESLHVPYFAFVEDPEAAIARVPAGREVVAVCAKGGSSAMVVDLLREAGRPARNVEGGMVAYGEHLQAVRVPLRPDEAARFELWQVNRRGKGCLSYVVRAGAEAVVVDPTRDVAYYERLVGGLGARVVRVLETHVQADHVSGGAELARRAGVPYVLAPEPGVELRPAATPPRDGEGFRVGGPAGVEVRPWATPGHTPGSTSYLVGARHLLCGDTLFVAGVGRPDLGGHAEAWARDLFRTLRRLETLPDDVVVLPAHYAGAGEIGADGVVAGRLGDLRRTVPELALDEPAFVRAMVAAVRPAPPAYAEIVRVNRGQPAPEGDRVTEWELGRNECAADAPPAGR